MSPELVINTTFPPVDGPTPGSEDTDPCDTTLAGSDPFTGSNASASGSGGRERRSSEYYAKSNERETGIAEKDEEKEVLKKDEVRSVVSVPSKGEVPLPAPDPPLCTLVVDDDK
jgi:hypothetical protein